jgi:Tol biopolymer transport system component
VDAPAWSLDGSKLIFSMNPQPDTSVGLYVLDMNTHEAQKVPGSEGVLEVAMVAGWKIPGDRGVQQ